MTRPDIVVIDQTATSVHSDVEHLQLITQRFESIPILLLAQRSDEADMLIEQRTDLPVNGPRKNSGDNHHNLGLGDVFH